MADYLVTDTELTSVANAIRTKGGTSGTLSFPTGFVSAINDIQTGITPTGTKEISITANGTTTTDVTNYATAEVVANVPNTYTQSDEGKVVSSGALVAQTSDTVTENDTYDTTLINSLTVNVSGGSGGVTLLATAEYQVSTTSTTASFVGTITVSPASSVWNLNSIIYVKVRDKAGVRDGYFYGTDNYWVNYSLWNVSSTTSGGTTMARVVYRGNQGMIAVPIAGNYGVYLHWIWSTGEVTIYKRYNSTYTKTIDGTFKVEVYAIPLQGVLPPKE